MEIKCEQCGTVFSVEQDPASGSNREVVCPGCFQFHIISRSEDRSSLSKPSSIREQRDSPLGDGGVVDRLRDGFTLCFEVRHPSWPSSRQFNPYEIKRLIYVGELDGQEEFREKAGRWFPIGEHPDFSLAFQLIGKPQAVERTERVEDGQRKFTGWKQIHRRNPKPARVEPAQDQGPLPSPALSRKWVAVAAAGTLAAVIGLTVAFLL